MKNNSSLKEKNTLKSRINSSDAEIKGNKVFNWTKVKHLSKKDRADLKALKKLYDQGKFQKALQYGSNLDTLVRDSIPPAIWKEIGGKLTKEGENELLKQKNRINLLNSKKFSTRSDALNPRYLFQSTATQLLVEALQKLFDVDYYIRRELACRGVDENGTWVGFPEAKKIHQIEWE